MKRKWLVVTQWDEAAAKKDSEKHARTVRKIVRSAQSIGKGWTLNTDWKQFRLLSICQIEEKANKFVQTTIRSPIFERKIQNGFN